MNMVDRDKVQRHQPWLQGEKTLEIETWKKMFPSSSGMIMFQIENLSTEEYRVRDKKNMRHSFVAI